MGHFSSGSTELSAKALRVLGLGLAALLLWSPGARGVDEAVLGEIRRLAEERRQEWRVPGLALAVVRDGEVALAEGFGLRDVERGLPVTPRTLFAIGSATKAFTAALLAMLVDEGRLAWDQPVRTYLPDFALEDPFASERLTPRDLLTHRSGLPRHDLVWYGSPLPREELYRRLRHLPPSADLRVRFQYQNLMYMTAGYLAGRLTGSTWEAEVERRIFAPLGMTASNFSAAAARALPDAAVGYDPTADGPVAMPPRDLAAIAPAGAINANALEMAQWVRLNLARGRAGGRQLISEAQMAELHGPQMVIRGGRFEQLFTHPAVAPQVAYGLGWFVQLYRGRPLVHHGGSIDGFRAMVALLPDDGLGLVILTNSNATLLHVALAWEIFDRLLGYRDVDWSAVYHERFEEIERGEEAEDDPAPTAGTAAPGHPLAEYAGTFEHPAYGELAVAHQGEGLRAAFHGLALALAHHRAEVFRVAEGPAAGLTFTFQGEPGGEVARVAVDLEPEVPAIVFERTGPGRVAAAGAAAPISEPGSEPAAAAATAAAPPAPPPVANLGRYAGHYRLDGWSIRVFLGEDGFLRLVIPGQPILGLEPVAAGEFTVQGLAGASVRFVEREGAVAELQLTQPGGGFTAVRER